MEPEILKRAKYVEQEETAQSCDDSEWQEIKRDGSPHYKAGFIEPIDLMRDIPPHQSLTVLMVKALGDIIKYAYRMLVKGANESDCDKIIHYARMVRWMVMNRG